ncbi:MAG: YceI family protein [Saprospiraceae bacterium]
MTKLFFALLLIAGSITAQAGNPENGTPYKVKADQSVIAWTGHKVTGQHNGTIAIKDGTLNINDGILSGGSFTIDMTSISDLDQQGEGKTKLEGHLKSDDFFGVATYPTASFKITKTTAKGNGQYNITADLTIKGITNPVTFDATLKTVSNQVTATADIKVDRTLYNIRYGSGKFFDNLGDKAIYDEFDLNVKLVAASK